MNFFISITTIKKYKIALDILLDSLPNEWKNKYILIYQDESKNDFKVFDDGHIEVYITNNLSDYGIFIGLNMLFERNIISENSWILCIHDTCKFLGENCVELTYKIINTFNNSDYHIVWLSNTGQCNICLIRKNAIQFGNNFYKNIKFISKMDTIKYEWEHNYYLSPKAFNVKQHFINIPTKNLGKRFVYNNNNERNILLYQSINMEKYYFYTNKESDHPLSP